MKKSHGCAQEGFKEQLRELAAREAAMKQEVTLFLSLSPRPAPSSLSLFISLS
jgi:hypothetical protein